MADSVQLTVEPSKRAITRDAVRSVQRMLAVQGYDPGAIDGFTGRKAEDAIRDYQTQAGLKVDGKVTRRLVNHLSRSTTKFVQGMLDLQGYDAGRIDGYRGSKTKIAIRVYKAQAGLKVSGKITQELAEHLVRDTARSVQRMLAARGHDPGPIDGNVGQKTLDAISEYQDQADLEVDPRISMDLVEQLVIESTKLVQGMLAARGYDAGPIDGDVGRKTVIAIRKYQTQAGLVVDGKFSLNLLEHLSASTGGSARAPDIAGPDGVVTGYTRGDLKPVYEIGDTFAYSDGRIETVDGVGGNKVWWRVEGGDSYTAYRNFLLPRANWQTEAGNGETTIDLDADKAWPATTRTNVSFSVSVLWTRAETVDSAVKTSEAWRCRRKAGKRVTVAAGIFETIPIVCERSGLPQDAWHKRIWYYAPSVRHYVRRESFSGEEIRKVDLVAIRPGARDWPPAARGGLNQAIQHTLENQPVGTEAKWESTAVGAKFGVVSTSEADRPDGANCRTYVLIRSDADSPRVYPAVACRNEKSGSWLTPVLDRDKGAAGAQL
jgi:peptidoglycan hydrolase-like protein with peptidoglycan-binding domain